MLPHELPAGGAPMPASSGLGAPPAGRTSPVTATLYLARGRCIDCVLTVEALGEFRIPVEVVGVRQTLGTGGPDQAPRQHLQPSATSVEPWGGFRPMCIDDVVRRIGAPQ